MSIPFTQYLRPDGRPSPVTIDRPPEIETLAQEVIARGLRFECEHLMTGAVSLTVFDPKKETDVAIEVCENGPPVLVAVDKLVTDAHAHCSRKKRVRAPRGKKGDA